MTKTEQKLQALILQSTMVHIPCALGSIPSQHEQHIRQLLLIIISHTQGVARYQERIAFAKEVYSKETDPSMARRATRSMGQLVRQLRMHQSNLAFGISRFKEFYSSNPALGNAMLLILQEFGVNVDASSVETAS